MKAEEAKKLADDALENLESALKAGKSEALTAYLASMSRFHHYSWGNVLLTLSQKPDAERVAGFNAWRQFGRFVKKGEKGIVIIAPMVIKPKEDISNGDSDDRTILRFKAVHVFDVSQTDGEPLPEFARVNGNPNGHTDRLKGFLSQQAITLEYADTLFGAKGRSHGGRIELLSGLSPAEEFSVLTHETAHEMLHRGDRRSETTKTLRETEAEAVAFVVCHAIGLETGTAASDYIQLYAGDKETLARSLDLIQKTASVIIGAIMPEQSSE